MVEERKIKTYALDCFFETGSWLGLPVVLALRTVNFLMSPVYCGTHK